MSKETSLTFPVVTLGDASVGKSSLYNVCMCRKMDNIRSSCCMLFLTRKITLDDREVMLELWDTHG